MNATKKFALATILLIAVSAFTILAMIQDAGRKRENELVLYYGNACPHCIIVEQFIEQNNLSEKLDITQREVNSDEANRRDFALKAGICGLDPEKLGVPMLWDAASSKCFIGDQPIIEFLKHRSGYYPSL